MTRGFLLLIAVTLVGCADSKAVNAAFSQTRVSWFVFDPSQVEGVRPLQGFEQPQKVTWQPRNRAVFATDLAQGPGGLGAAAVSGLGLLLLDDADGTLRMVRPGSLLPLPQYQTGRLFVWDGKLFLTLLQETPFELPAATLAWWTPGQSRVALYPIPSQVQDPTRQAMMVEAPSGSSVVSFTWKVKTASGWSQVPGTLDLSNGTEGVLAGEIPAETPLGKEFGAVKARLAERLGVEVPSRPLRGPGIVMLFTASGWVAVAKEGQGQARLYRLPDLGLAGSYPLAVALDRGVAFAWETSFRGYSGAAGLVYVPFQVLGP